MSKSHFRFSALIAAGALASLAFATLAPAAFADSTTFDGPGMRVEDHQDWFGRHSASYDDAFGNKLEKRKGWFGRTTTDTRVFGSEAIVRPNNNVSVRDASGRSLITTRHTLFGGRNTHVDGNSIMNSVNAMFNNGNNTPRNAPLVPQTP